jgi:hypothetical protein
MHAGRIGDDVMPRRHENGKFLRHHFCFRARFRNDGSCVPQNARVAAPIRRVVGGKLVRWGFCHVRVIAVRIPNNVVPYLPGESLALSTVARPRVAHAARGGVGGTMPAA